MTLRYGYYALMAFSIGLFVLNASKQAFPFLPKMPSMELFPLKEVSLKGLVHLDPGDVFEQLGLEGSPSLLFLNKETIRSRLESNPRIEVRSIAKKYPKSLVVDVREREGSFVVWDEEAIGGSLYEITEEALVLGYDDDVVGINKFRIQWNQPWLNSVGRAKDSVKEELLSNFLEAYRGLPEDERDFTEFFSGIELGGVSTLLLRARDLSVLLNYPITKTSLRQARYALVYERYLGGEAKQIDLRHDKAKVVMKH